MDCERDRPPEVLECKFNDDSDEGDNNQTPLVGHSKRCSIGSTLAYMR